MDLDTNQDIAQTSSTNQQTVSASASATRSSARVRAARQRHQQQQLDADSQLATGIEETEVAPLNRKGKGKAFVPSLPASSARPRRSLGQSQPLTINEPIRDPKGKKRALPSPDPSSSELSELSDDEPVAAQSSYKNTKSRQPPPKRLKTSNSTYITRGKPVKKMPTKSRVKKGESSNAGPSNEDVEMADNSDHEIANQPEEIQVKSEEEAQVSTSKTEASTSTAPLANASASTAADAIVPETSSSSSSPDPPPVPPADAIPTSSSPVPPVPPPAEQPMSLMGGDFEYGAYMASLGSRLKTLLNNIKANADPTTRLMALQDLSEILSMSTEDNLNGYFSQDSFVRELVRIMGGKGEEENTNNEENNNNGDDVDSVDDAEENQPNPDTNAEGNATAPATGDASMAVTGDATVAGEAVAVVVEGVEVTMETPNAVGEPTPATEVEPTPAAEGDPSPPPPAEATTSTTVPEVVAAIEITAEVIITPTSDIILPVETTSPVNPPAENTPLTEPPAENTPPVNLPVENTLPVDPPVENMSDANPPAENTPDANLLVEDTPAANPPAEDTPTATSPVPDAAPIINPLDALIPEGMLIDPDDEDAALAAALAMSAGDAGIDMAAFGGAFGEPGVPEVNLEEQLLACRCLANLMEAMPGSAHTLVYHGAVPVLCGKLVEITFIDLAEQTISTLEKLSEEYPSAIVRENGLSALLNYLDFFSTHVQRTALQAAANCCRNMSSDSYPMIKDVFPTIKNVLSYSDQRLVELASMCVIRTIESFARSLPTELEQLITPDLVRSINALLVPQSASSGGGSSAGSQMISPSTATLFLRALSAASKSSPNIAITLLESGIANTLYAFLTGVLPPNQPQQEQLEEGIVDGIEGEIGMGGQGVGSGVVDMAVMQNLAGRPKDQVEEALSLISELMPPLPRDGVFDPRGYTEKYVSRALKAKVKEAKAEAKAREPSTSTSKENPAAESQPSIKVELAPQEAEIAAMLLIPESEAATPNNDASTSTAEVSGDANVPPTSSPEASVTPQPIVVDAPSISNADVNAMATENLALTFNPALTNAEGEPLMAMMTDDADLPNPPSSQNTQDQATAATDAAPEVPAEVIAAVAGNSSSSGRHRHGESSQTHARLKLLREKPAVVSRFLYLIVPVLFDVYSASVTLQVRMRCFTGILKATSFVDGVGMELMYKNVPVASFIGSILTGKDNPLLVTNALQLVELLLIKSPSVFRNSLRKEGVLHEVSTISKIELKVKAKPPPPEGGENAENNDDGSAPPPPRKSSSIPSDPQDAYVLRARLIKIKYLTGGSDIGGDPVFDSLKAMIKILTDTESSEEQLIATLKDIAKLFSGSSGADISSFELLKSGLVDGLLDFATASGLKVATEKRREMFFDAFFARSGSSTPSSQSQSPISVLVKRLQESLTRMESFEVVTTSPGSMEDAKRSSMNLISRTLRLKLVAENPADVPKSCQNLMVSIHAIAPFSALDDYLKPRIAGLLSFRPELTPGLLQALAGSGLPSSTMAQSVLSRLAARPGPGSSGSSAVPSTFGALLGALTSNTASTISGPSTPAATSSSSTTLPIPIPGRRQSGRSNGQDAAETSTSEGAGVTRRRSLRLRGQPPDASDAVNATAEPASSTSAPASSSTTIASTQQQPSLASAMLQQLLMDDGEFDDGLDDEIGDDVDVPVVAERSFNLAFDSPDGGLTASTPHGTRIATPLPGTTPVGDPAPIASLSPAGNAKNSNAPKLSYADAAISAMDKANDFHLEFKLNGEVLPTDMTVYGACHQFEARRSADGHPNTHAVWNGNYTVTFRKIPGKRPTTESMSEDEMMETDIVAGLAPDSPSSKILRLLRVLYRLNSESIQAVDSHGKAGVIADAAFINNKLTAKLARQLEEIMILASNCLPDWALDLPQGFGFLFPFSTRYLFLQSTSFGYARLLNRVISQIPRDAPNNNRREGLEQYGRLQRRKVEVPRDAPIQVALKVFDLFGSSSSILDVHFQGEVGTGLGPTLEFFASVCREFAWRDLKLWRDADNTIPGRYVHHPTGLFPAPMLSEVVNGSVASERDKRRIRLYKLLGQFVARALLDSRIIDISFNKVFVKLILGDHVPLTIGSVKLVDPTLGHSLASLQQFAKLKQAIEKDNSIKKAEKNKRIANLEVNGVKLEDMCLDFTVPGYDDLELKPKGKSIDVTAKNVEEYIDLVVDAILGRGARPAVNAFKEGFSTVFPVTDLRTFSPEELIMMFGNTDEDWSSETLNEAIKADHGFNVESKAIRDLIEIMNLYDKNGRRDFLQFITGSPKLPIGGFKALNPQLTVVRKPHEAPLTPDDYLPSVMTCAHYLKLPSYSSRSVMEKKLLIAMREGTGSFHLS